MEIYWATLIPHHVCCWLWKLMILPKKCLSEYHIVNSCSSWSLLWVNFCSSNRALPHETEHKIRFLSTTKFKPLFWVYFTGAKLMLFSIKKVLQKYIFASIKGWSNVVVTCATVAEFLVEVLSKRRGRISVVGDSEFNSKDPVLASITLTEAGWRAVFLSLRVNSCAELFVCGDAE